VNILSENPVEMRMTRIIS